MGSPPRMHALLAAISAAILASTALAVDLVRREGGSEGTSWGSRRRRRRRCTGPIKCYNVTDTNIAVAAGRYNPFHAGSFDINGTQEGDLLVLHVVAPPGISASTAAPGTEWTAIPGCEATAPTTGTLAAYQRPYVGGAAALKMPFANSNPFALPPAGAFSILAVVRGIVQQSVTCSSTSLAKGQQVSRVQTWDSGAELVTFVLNHDEGNEGVIDRLGLGSESTGNMVLGGCHPLQSHPSPSDDEEFVQEDDDDDQFHRRFNDDEEVVQEGATCIAATDGKQSRVANRLKNQLNKLNVLGNGTNGNTGAVTTITFEPKPAAEPNP